jgi:DNA-binding transcriptional LysR family regulator
LFDQPLLSREQLLEQDGVHHPYRFTQADEPWQSTASSARSEQVEGSLAFVLSGAHIGYLPRHIAAPWVERGQLRALLAEQLGFHVQFHLASHRGRQPSETQQAMVEDLLTVFS